MAFLDRFPAQAGTPDSASFSKRILHAAGRVLRLAGNLFGFTIDLQLCIADDFAEHFLRAADHLLTGTNQPVFIHTYFLVSFAAAFGSFGCGRRNVEAAGATFLSALGFFSSRSLPPRPLANVVLLLDTNRTRRVTAWYWRRG
jgi:hypothetical protein